MESWFAAWAWLWWIVLTAVIFSILTALFATMRRRRDRRHLYRQGYLTRPERTALIDLQDRLARGQISRADYERERDELRRGRKAA